MKPVVFISREPSESEQLLRMLHNDGIQALAQSMIRTEAVNFDPNIPETDWIFFSSANAVRYFFGNTPAIGQQKFGAIGNRTARELIQYRHPEYVGNSIQTMTTAKEFANFIGEKTVLFPGAEESLRSIQSVFVQDKIIDLVCYRTIHTPVEITPADVLIFSSPSNVQSYLSKNSISANQKTIAFGHSTQKTLAGAGVRNTIIPESLSDEGIYKAIKLSVHS